MDDPKKPASGQAEEETGEWDPQPAQLREGETPDESSHARRNLDLIRSATRDLLPDEGVRVTTSHQDFVVSSDTDVDGLPAVLLTTPDGDQELYRLRFDQGPREPPLLEYHRPDKSQRPVGGSHPRTWHPKSRQASWAGYESGEADE